MHPHKPHFSTPNISITRANSTSRDKMPPLNSKTDLNGALVLIVKGAGSAATVNRIIRLIKTAANDLFQRVYISARGAGSPGSSVPLLSQRCH